MPVKVGALYILIMRAEVWKHKVVPSEVLLPTVHFFNVFEYLA